MNCKTLFSLTLLLLFCQNIICQETQVDSLKNTTYESLKTLFFENMEDNSIAKTYAIKHLLKAKKEENIIKLADSYLYMSYVSKSQVAIEYSDSIINLTINLKHKFYPALGFMIKGYHLYNSGRDKEALNQYLRADEFAVINNNLKQLIEIKQFIGGVKYNFGDYRDALVIFQNQLRFIKKQSNYKDNYSADYLISLDDLSKTFLRGKATDSALFYTNEGIIESLRKNEKVMYNRFLLTSGSCFYFKKKYQRALDSLNKLEPKINDPDRLAMCLYYKAKAFEHINSRKAIDNFNKVDSIYQITKQPFIELRNVYKSLYNFSIKKGKEKEQLINLKKLIEIDSILDLNHSYSEMEIIKKYDIPKLKEDKKQLETTMRNNSKNRIKTYYGFGVIILIGLFFIFKFHKNQKLYKSRFDKIMLEKETIIVLESEVSENKDSSKSELNIPEEILKEILSKLEIFEKNNDFLDKKITLNSISKKLKTNSSYLSKIINHYKKQTFSKYMNGLRIRYAVNELKTNPVFRNYTINAIAQESGFNTAESFSRAFFKEKGLYPSYFIKQINKA